MATEKRRLIDANAVLKKMQNWNTKERLINCVEDAPTVDAVPVVRCKDCKHFVSPQGVPVCVCFYGLRFPSLSGDDFCPYGERREGK